MVFSICIADLRVASAAQNRANPLLPQPQKGHPIGCPLLFASQGIHAPREDFSPSRWCASTPTAFGSNADLHSAPAAQNRANPLLPQPQKGHPIGCPFCGWGSRIRTYECQSQSLVPYRLAIPHSIFLCHHHDFGRTLVLYHIISLVSSKKYNLCKIFYPHPYFSFSSLIFFQKTKKNG